MASADLVVHKYVEETTYGVTPTTPALTKVNVVSSSIDANISTTVSNQINPTRSESDLIQTEGTTSGDIGVEWQYSAYDSFIEGALGSDFATAFSVTATNISAAATDQSLNSVSGGFSTTLILPGYFVIATGFSGGNVGNNGIPMKVVSVTPSKMVVSGVTIVDDAAGESVTVKTGATIRNGTTKKSYTIEKEFGDLATTFVAHKGMVVNTMNINAAVGSVVSGSFGFNGSTTTYGAATVGTGAEIAATSNQVFSPVNGIGSIYVDGVVTTDCVRSLNLTTTNNTRNVQCLGDLYPDNVNLGTIGITGTAEIYFNNTTLLNKFINGTAISLAYSFNDDTGNDLVIFMPNVKFNTGTLSGISKNSDVMVSLSFTGLYSSSAGYAIQISSIPA